MAFRLTEERALQYYRDLVLPRLPSENSLSSSELPDRDSATEKAQSLSFEELVRSCGEIMSASFDGGATFHYVRLWSTPIDLDVVRINCDVAASGEGSSGGLQAIAPEGIHSGKTIVLKVSSEEIKDLTFPNFERGYDAQFFDRNPEVMDVVRERAAKQANS